MDGKEVFDKSLDKELPYEIEHIYPDYSIYPEETGWGKPLKHQTAFGFCSRGCPRGCSFCHVAAKEGKCSHKVASLSEFWNGQGHIELLDPNTLACPDWKDILQELIDSKAKVDFNQGVDIRMMTPEKAEMIGRVKTEKIHFAWDRYEDKDIVQPRFKEFKKYTKIDYRQLQVYVLCGDRERRIRDEDFERVYWLRENGYLPYIMLYDKEHLPRGHELKQFQRWVNNRFVFAKCKTFEEYKEYMGYT